MNADTFTKALTFLESVFPVTVQRPSLEELAEVCRVREFAKGDYIFWEGDEPSHGFYVMDGRVALYKTSPNGKSLMVGLLATGEPFGTLAALDKRPYPLCAQAQCRCSVLEFPISAFGKFLSDNPEVNAKLLQMLGARLRFSHEFSRSLAHDRAETRVAAILLSLKPFKDGQNFQILMSRQELADAVGITLETATRTMKRLEAEGIVNLSRLGCIQVLQADALQTYIV